MSPDQISGLPENPKFIVGCDIRGYSSLEKTNNEDPQNLLTAHLLGCHIKSLAKTKLTPEAFNDTGDGFFVVFDLDKYLPDPCERYVKELCGFYYSECERSISKYLKTNWLKIAFGTGPIYITPQQGIRGDGINTMKRILDGTKLPVPLKFQGTLRPPYNVTENADNQGYMYIEDKNAYRHYVLPCCPVLSTELKDKLPFCLAEETSNGIKSGESYPNPYQYLQKPCLPPDFIKDVGKQWWRLLDEYFSFSAVLNKTYNRDKNEWVKYLNSIYITGLTLEYLHELLSIINKVCSTNDTPYPSKIQVIYLDPESADELGLSDDKKLSEKIRTSLSNNLKVISNDATLSKRLHIKFSAKPVSIGMYKVLDYMTLTSYGEDHRSQNAHYKLINYFDSKNQSEFMFYIRAYFESLWENMMRGGNPPENQLNYITREAVGEDGIKRILET